MAEKGYDMHRLGTDTNGIAKELHRISKNSLGYESNGLAMQCGAKEMNIGGRYENKVS